MRSRLKGQDVVLSKKHMITAHDPPQQKIKRAKEPSIPHFQKKRCQQHLLPVGQGGCNTGAGSTKLAGYSCAYMYSSEKDPTAKNRAGSEPPPGLPC